MNSKNVKVVDEHGIDRNANVMFAFDLEGSEYVVYWIERDEENNNIFVSKVIKNLDSTFNMLNIDDTNEKIKITDIVKNLISSSVSSQADTLDGDSVTLSDGKVVKFIAVSFNREQKINVQKTYITTVKKQVTRVAEKYYAVEIKVEEPKVVEEVFPSIFPVAEEPKVEPAVTVAQPEVVIPEPVLEIPVVTPTPAPSVLAVPTVEVPQEKPAEEFVAFGTEVQPEVVAPAPVLPQPEAKVEQPVPQPVPTVVEPITVPESVVTPAVPKTETPVVDVLAAVQPAPVPAQPVSPAPAAVTPSVLESAPASEVSQPLVFNASKETNLNAALGEVASTSTIPVENIQPVREFGVDEPVTQPVVNVTPAQPGAVVNNPADTGNVGGTPSSQKGGFANSKFFMVVAVAFFLASCVFLGYEVFNYFQLTK